MKSYEVWGSIQNNTVGWGSEQIGADHCWGQAVVQPHSHVQLFTVIILLYLFVPMFSLINSKS